MGQNSSYFEYNDGGNELAGYFKISPSQISKFFDRTSEWYRENLLGEQGFTGSTASHLGTVVHAGIEMYINEGQIDFDAIETFVKSIKDPLIDKDYILEKYPDMVSALIGYVDSQDIKSKPRLRTEEYVYTLNPKTKIAVAGSIDLSCAGKIRDWKTTSSTSLPKKMSRAYWFQQMVYVWLLKQNGIDIHTISLVYVNVPDTGRISEKTGKPLKQYPSVVQEVSELVTEEGLALIESVVNLVSESVVLWNNKPELRHVLAQDMRLKVKQKKKLKKVKT